MSLKDFLYAEWKETACQLKTEGKAEIRAFLDHRWEPVTRKGEPRREQEEHGSESIYCLSTRAPPGTFRVSNSRTH